LLRILRAAPSVCHDLRPTVHLSHRGTIRHHPSVSQLYVPERVTKELLAAAAIQRKESLADLAGSCSAQAEHCGERGRFWHDQTSSTRSMASLQSFHKRAVFSMPASLGRRLGTTEPARRQDL
jgi:hypothetical protein